MKPGTEERAQAPDTRTKPLTGRIPTEDELFFIAWGRETLKSNLQLTNSILSQLLTLNTALLGGSVVLLSPKHSVECARWWAIILFLFGLIFSFVGILPYTEKIDRRSPTQIETHKSRVLEYKLGLIYLSALFTGVAFFVIIVGMTAKYFFS